MSPASPNKPLVFIDADVLFAGAASPTEHGASLLILRLAEIRLIEAVASEQVITEAEHNLEAKVPKALPAFNHLVNRCLRFVKDPEPEDLQPYNDLADPKDLPILVTALRESCPWLVTFNTRHYQPGHKNVSVVSPGDFVLRIRDLLTQL
jgi:predicted nucleic acid-binding protein